MTFGLATTSGPSRQPVPAKTTTTPERRGGGRGVVCLVDASRWGGAQAELGLTRELERRLVSNLLKG